MKFSVPKAIDTDPCDSTVVIHNALVCVGIWLTEISVHMENIRSVQTPWMSEQIFPRINLELG